MKKQLVRGSTIWIRDSRLRIELHKRGPFFTVTHNFQIHDPKHPTQTLWFLTYNGASIRFLEIFLNVKTERDMSLGY